MVNQDYVNYLVERDKAKPPLPDPSPYNPSRLDARCQICGWVLTYRIEQFCCVCGQRFVDNKNNEFYEVRNGDTKTIVALQEKVVEHEREQTV